MADADTARLCTQIVRSVFGPLTATVASVLLTYGRLGLSQLVRFSKLKPRIVRVSILALAQHNLLWHAQSDDGEVFEINTDECLMRLRYGRFVWLAEELYGKAGGEIVQLILDHGKLRPPDIVSQLSIYDPLKAPAVVSQTLYKLVEAGYLKPSTVISHWSPRDKRLRYEAEEKRKISGFPTAKELREAKEIADARLKREEEEAGQVGMKRKAKDQSYKSSKRKGIEEEAEVDGEVYFRVNCERFNVHIRNKLIECTASERFNHCTGLVLRATLKATESKQRKLSDIRSDPTSLGNIAMHLPDDVDLSAGLVLQSSKKLPAMTLLKEYLGILASADNPTPAGCSASFISMNGSKVQVEFEIIARRLRRRVLEAVARERHGDEGVRIIRLLLDTGMMDEKQISKVGMMAPKDVRPLLSSMSAESLVSLQEVPKSADRNPTRMFYLWYVDLQKAYNVLLGNLYKTLYNIAARRQAEQAELNLKAVLEKRQRSDVSQDEERLLTRNERELLAQWEKKREKLTVLEMRVEEAVFILRDLGTFAINEE
ncbi:RNA polymerase III subunit RPC82-domain-containing protein [Ganoderma leucocontextum]|nr:RNA polymerase III subunit RPC82-domain-containing protein [Ganoderma leucocontextum]